MIFSNYFMVIHVRGWPPPISPTKALTMSSTYFELLILLSTSLIVNGQMKCLTTSDSKDPRQPCIFPFKFKGTKYNGCPPYPEVPGRRWCSTAVDNWGNHVTGRFNFGFCEESCPHHKEPKSNYVHNLPSFQ